MRPGWPSSTKRKALEKNLTSSQTTLCNKLAFNRCCISCWASFLCVWDGQYCNGYNRADWALLHTTVNPCCTLLAAWSAVGLFLWTKDFVKNANPGIASLDSALSTSMKSERWLSRESTCWNYVTIAHYSVATDSEKGFSALTDIHVQYHILWSKMRPYPANQTDEVRKACMYTQNDSAEKSVLWKVMANKIPIPTKRYRPAKGPRSFGSQKY